MMYLIKLLLADVAFALGVSQLEHVLDDVLKQVNACLCQVPVKESRRGRYT